MKGARFNSSASNWGVLSGRVLTHSRTEDAGHLTGCDCKSKFHWTCQEAFYDYRNAVLHNERITWAGVVAKVMYRQAFWTSPSKRCLTIVPRGQFWPPASHGHWGSFIWSLSAYVVDLRRDEICLCHGVALSCVTIFEAHLLRERNSHDLGVDYVFDSESASGFGGSNRCSGSYGCGADVQAAEDAKAIRCASEI